jgi:hypothetical protein
MISGGFWFTSTGSGIDTQFAHKTGGYPLLVPVAAHRIRL